MNDSQKVLVVDDDPYILMSLEFLMKKSGYQVFVARNGTEALEIIHRELPKLVLLDIMMPDVDGYAICKMVKENAQLKHIKIVFVSAKTREEDIKRGYDLGAELCISKPFSTKDLVKKVKEILA